MLYLTKKVLTQDFFSTYSQFWIPGFIRKEKSFEVLVLGAILLSIFIATSSSAQSPIEVTLSHEIGTPNEGFILLDFKGNGATSGFQADIVYDDSNIVGTDLSDCLAGNDALFATCVHPGPPGSVDTSRIRILLATLPSLGGLGDFTGILVFDFDGTLQDQDVIDFEWDPNSIVASDPEADVITNDGSITIIDP